tara:strand:- start:5912 stop:6907 length:996 start_codon:yes stop_codon:yes gene_type:complete
MKFYKVNITLLTIFLLFNLDANQTTGYEQRPEVIDFIKMMHTKHGLDRKKLIELFSGVIFQERVVRIMNKQPEGTLTWSKYKRMMISEDRINSGKKFIRSYRKDLERAEEIYGVPIEIIASIIGIETKYGKIMGNTRVLDSLSTLSFDYPRRSKFFKIQLEEFLLLAEEEALDPSKIKGSIAGAMGYGQFMPDSYRNYAVDFDFDGKRDILDNPVDAIGSVANFLNKKGKWEPNTKVAIKAKLVAERPILKSSFSPYIIVSDLDSIGINPAYKLHSSLEVVPIELELDEGYEYWLGLKNYQALSRYNRSKLYIMAVFEFSESLSKIYNFER